MVTARPHARGLITLVLLLVLLLIIMAVHAKAIGDPYKILGVAQGASEQDIKSAYRKLAMK